MNRIATRALKVGVTVSVIAGIVALTTSSAHAILLDVYLLCLGGVLLLALVRTTRAHALPPRVSQLDEALLRMRKPVRESRELALVRDVELSTHNAFHLHVRVRPLLRDVAAHRLRARYGVDLDAEAARARELVGAAAWELVRPRRPAPADRMAPGPTLEHLALVVSELEAI